MNTKKTQETGKAMVFFKQEEPFRQLSYPLPKLKDNEVLVQNIFSTICGSDLHTFTGKRKEKTPTILGHEMVGRIHDIAEQADFKDYNGEKLSIGDKVTWSVMASCGQCINCKKNMPQKCISLKKYGHEKITEHHPFSGGFAEYTHLWPGTAIFKLSEEIPARDQSWLNCAFATTMAAIRAGGNIANKNVLITGAGALGLLAIPVCLEQGASKIAIADPSPERRNLAKEFGAKQVYDPNEIKTEAEADCKFDVILEMSGQTGAIETALPKLATGGTFVFVGSVFPQSDILLNPEMIVRNLWTLRGIHNYIPEDLGNAVAFHEKHYKKYPFNLITSPQTFSFKETNEAIRFALNTKDCRVGIEIM